jgi:hypothetical protein
MEDWKAGFQSSSLGAVTIGDSPHVILRSEATKNLAPQNLTMTGLASDRNACYNQRLCVTALTHHMQCQIG